MWDEGHVISVHQYEDITSDQSLLLLWLQVISIPVNLGIFDIPTAEVWITCQLFAAGAEQDRADHHQGRAQESLRPADRHQPGGAGEVDSLRRVLECEGQTGGQQPRIHRGQSRTPHRPPLLPAHPRHAVPPLHHPGRGQRRGQRLL